MLHLRCGDDILPTLRAAGLPGAFAAWADPLCQGPLRRWPDPAARRSERAAWLAARLGRPEPAVREGLEAADAALEAARAEDEVVLWFEHDLYDQAILCFLLATLADRPPARVSLICIGSHPEVPDFVGLGNLNADQLAALFPARQPVGGDQFELARQAWDALTGGDPEAIWRLATAPSGALPFLPAALRRYLAELPSVRNGLGQTESLALHAVAAGADRARHVFATVQRFEPSPWLGDEMFYGVLRGLADGAVPLLRGASGGLPAPGDPGFAEAALDLTPEGRAVLTGRADWCTVAPRTWRLGAIPVEGPEPLWRWDDRAERPVRSGQDASR